MCAVHRINAQNYSVHPGEGLASIQVSSSGFWQDFENEGNYQVKLVAVIPVGLSDEVEIILMQVEDKYVGQDKARICVNRDRRRGAVIGGRS